MEVAEYDTCIVEQYYREMSTVKFKVTKNMNITVWAITLENGFHFNVWHTVLRHMMSL